MGPDSDIDLLVVMPEGVHRRRCAQEIHRHLFGVPLPVDVLVSTPGQLERHADNIGLVYGDILRDGRVLYGE
jgi:hypothetical protein